MKPVEIILPLVAALWASGSLFFLASKERNEKRDRILSGYLEGKRMSREHRLLLLRGDWVPLGVVLVCLSTTLAAISICLPLLLAVHERHPAIWVVSGFTLAYSLSCSTLWLWNGVREYRFMKRHIDEDLSSVEREPG